MICRLGLVLALMCCTVQSANASRVDGPSNLLQESRIFRNHTPSSLNNQHDDAVASIARGGGGVHDGILTITQRAIPTLFPGELERHYDTYAACLAATEGLRRIRDRQQLVDPAAARRQYVRDSKPVLETLGMTIDRFNSIGAQIAEDEALKEKVVQQAFLYRAATLVTTDRYPIHTDERIGSISKSKLQNFCRTMADVESLRNIQAERLKAHFRLGCELPSNLSDPAMLPFLCPPAREMVESFPVAAAALVQQSGLGCDEFNRMLAASRSNPILRWKVKKLLQQLVNQ